MTSEDMALAAEQIAEWEAQRARACARAGVVMDAAVWRQALVETQARVIEAHQPPPKRRDWPGTIGAALVLLFLIPGGCGVMVGSFVWATRAVGW